MEKRVRGTLLSPFTLSHSDDFEEGKKRLYLDLSPSISDSSIGERGTEYIVDYNGMKKRMELHLRGANSRRSELCLRVYFFWDDANSVVVVGYLPDHLETRGS